MDSSERIEEELEQSLLEDSINKEKETDQDLAKQYIECENRIDKIKSMIEKYKLDHSEIFEELQKYENQIAEIEAEKDGLKERLLDKMQEKFECLGYSFVKVITEVKRTFNTKLFYQDYLPTTRLYKKYVTESEVKPYVKITKLKQKKSK